MVPLDLVDIGKENVIKKVGGSPDIKNTLKILALRLAAW